MAIYVLIYIVCGPYIYLCTYTMSLLENMWKILTKEHDTLSFSARAVCLCVCVLYDMSRHHKLIYRQIKHCKVRDRSPGHAATINTTLWAKEISKAAGFWFAFLTTSLNGLSQVKIMAFSIKTSWFQKMYKKMRWNMLLLVTTLPTLAALLTL